MPLSPQQLVDRLVAILPGFVEQWLSPKNCYRDEDGSFTYWGAFAEFSHYVRDRYEELSVAQRVEIGKFIEECMNPPDTDIDNAAATCFLENLAFERFTLDLEQYLKGHSLKFYLASGRTNRCS